MGSTHFMTRARALVLEADAGEAAALVLALEELGFLTDHAARPNTANALLQVAEQEGAPYEVLVVANMVTGICGMDLAAALALRVRARPAIFLSSGPYSAPEPEQLARARCDGLFLRPWREEQFLATLAAVIPVERLRAIRAGTQIGLLAI